jgi:hypothetical protein
MRRILLALAVDALMAVMVVSSAAAQGGPPVGGCPASYDPGLVPVEFVLAHTGNLDPNREPDPSMDPNGDGLTCLTFLHTGSGTRVTWHDNVLPQ